MDGLTKLRRAHELCDRMEHFAFAMRKPQRELVRLLRGVADGLNGGSWPYLVSRGFITEEVVPGGGKSFSAVMAASVLVGSGLFDVALWISPRLNLISQAKDDFASVAVAMGHPDINKPINIFNPAGLIPHEIDRGHAHRLLDPRMKAFVLSYQRVRGILQFLVKLVESRNTLLIFDEFQLMKDVNTVRQEPGIDGPDSWYSDLEPLVMECQRRTGFGGIILSGGLFRNKGERLPLVAYRQGDRARGEDPKMALPMSDISYSLSEGQADHAIIKVDFDLYKGEVNFRSDGEDKVETLSKLSDDYYNDKLVLFLEEADVWQTILLDMLTSLDYYNPPGHGYRARYIVISKSIEDAKKHTAFLEAQGRKPLLIHSGKSGVENKRLEQFRLGQGSWDGLVCVAMGYIGLSIPDLSHMAYLSHYRSLAWINQAFGRVWRFDTNPRAPKYRDQLARIFAPNDPQMQELASMITAWQNPGVLAQPRPKPPTITCFPPGGGGGPDFEGHGASISGREFNTNGVQCREHDFIDHAVRQIPSLNAIPRKAVEDFKRFADQWGK